MIIKNITSNGFRNLENISFEPSDTMNVIFGNNAEGKTNLLEAIWLFCGAKSFRGAKDKEMLGFGREKAFNTCTFLVGGNENLSKIVIENKRRAEINGKKLDAASKLAGTFYAIVFSPLDLNLINEGPSVRRKFLDTAIGQIYPLYNETLREYMKALNQRNSVLRDIKFHPEIEELLEDFETSLARLNLKLLKYRQRYIENLKETVFDIYSGISSGKEELTVFYETKIKTEMSLEEVKKLYKECREKDIFTGNTSIGIHRDDIILYLDGKEIKSFGSQGQRRSAALSLKLAEAKVLKKITGEYPIALLDDVMSELDTKRQDFILNHIKEWQVFITCCDPANISGFNEGKVFKMSNGQLKEI